jgi:hypothetical protein
MNEELRMQNEEINFLNSRFSILNSEKYGTFTEKRPIL